LSISVVINKNLSFAEHYATIYCGFLGGFNEKLQNYCKKYIIDIKLKGTVPFLGQLI